LVRSLAHAARIIATWFGGGMMIGGAGAAYDDGIIGNIADPFGAALCLFVLALLWVAGMLVAFGLIILLVVVLVDSGVWWQKANRSGALAAMSMGIVSWLTTSLLYPELPGDLIGLGVSFVTMIIVTPLTQKIDPPRALVDIDGKPIELTDRLGTLR